jgi:uncharacterized protein (DUF885 family)
MLPRFFPLVALAVACASPPPPSGPSFPPPHVDAAGRVTEDTSDDAAIARAEQDYLDLVAAISPEYATALGIHTHDTELDDRTAAGVQRAKAREEAMLSDLTSRFAHAHASRAARTDLAVLTHALTVDIRTLRDIDTRRDVDAIERQPDLYTSPLKALYLMMAREYAPAEERARNAVARIEKIPALLAVAKTNLSPPPASGQRDRVVNPPAKVWTQVGIETAKSAKAFFEEERGPLLAALPGEKTRIEAALKAATAAYAEYLEFLEQRVLPRSTGEFAAGKSQFEFLIREDYFLKEDSDSLNDVAARLFAQTDAQMGEVAKRIDPRAKGWPEVTEKLKAKHPTADKLLESYRQEVARAKAFLVSHDAVPFPADDKLDVVDTPVFERSTITAEYEEPAPFDTVSKGFFSVTPVDKSLPPARQEEMLRENDWGDMVNTAVHETYPGHHLQLSFARLHPSLIRKSNSTAILEEGWALYCEELMNELGYYTDEQRLMQLEWTLVRAARVLIDIGLHTRGMTFEQAVAMLTDKVHLEHELAMSEVKRYTLEPTQPLSYLIGREMIFRLRERYKEREKDRFTLKRFHAELLSRGGIAPGLLAEEMFEP